MPARFVRLVAVVVCSIGLGALASGPPAMAADNPPVVKAEDIAKQYATNPKEFDAQYKDKQVVVTGVVALPKATDTITKTDWVILKGYRKPGDRIETIVRCQRTKELEGLKAKQMVRVLGTVHAHSPTLSAVELVDCKLEKK